MRPFASAIVVVLALAVWGTNCCAGPAPSQNATSGSTTKSAGKSAPADSTVMSSTSGTAAPSTSKDPSGLERDLGTTDSTQRNVDRFKLPPLLSLEKLRDQINNESTAKGFEDLRAARKQVSEKLQAISDESVSVKRETDELKLQDNDIFYTPQSHSSRARYPRQKKGSIMLWPYRRAPNQIKPAPESCNFLMKEFSMQKIAFKT